MKDESDFVVSLHGLSLDEREEVINLANEFASYKGHSKARRVVRFLLREVLNLLNDAVMLAVGLVAGERVYRFAYRIPMGDLTVPAYWQWFFITWLALLLILNYAGYFTRLVVWAVRRFLKIAHNEPAPRR